MEGKWNQIEDIYCNTANNTIEYLRSTDKTWLTWRIKEKEIKKSARHDKIAHVDNIALKVKTDAERGEISTFYRLTKQFCRHTNASVSIVKDKEGNRIL